MSNFLHSNPSAMRRAGRLGAGALLVGAPAAAVALAIATEPANASTIVVTNTGDSGAGSLRDALASAASGDTIDLTLIAGQTISVASPLNWTTGSTITAASNVTISAASSGHAFQVSGPGTHVLERVTITGATDGAILSGSDLTIRDSHLDGNGAVNNFAAALYSSSGAVSIENSTVDNNTGRSAVVARGQSLSISNSELSGNTALTAGGAVQAVYLGGDLTITNSTLSNNTVSAAGSNGAALDVYVVYGAVSITGSTFDGNVADNHGGAMWLYLKGATSTEISSTTITNNSARSGGGLYLTAHTADITISSSTISGNTLVAPGVGQGAGVMIGYQYNTGATARIFNSTIDHNTGGAWGAGVNTYAPTSIYNSTIAYNQAGYIGGIHAAAGVDSYGLKVVFSTITGNSETTPTSGAGITSAVDMTIIGTIVSGNSGTYDVKSNHLIGGDHDLFGTISVTASNQTTSSFAGQLANLYSLADNGGPTKTMDTKVASVARANGPTTFASFTGSAYDQRGAGWDRVVGNYSDIGAVTHQAPPPPTSTSTSSSSTTSTSSTSTSSTSTSSTSTSSTSTSSTSSTSTSSTSSTSTSTTSSTSTTIQPTTTTSSTSTSTTSTSTTSTTTPSPTTSTTIDVAPDHPATPADGQPLELPNGDGAMIEPDGTVTPLTITQTGPNSIGFGTQTIGANLTGSGVADGATLGLTVGATGSASGFGFQAGSTASVWIQSTPQRLGTATVDADGNFTTSFPVPANLPAGDHTVQLQGVGFDGEPRALAAGVTVASNSALPSTGRNLTTPVGIGTGLLLAGGAGVIASRRNRRPIGRHAR